MIYTTQNVGKNKPAFTLFELVIVVVLVGIIYYFAISNINFNKTNLDKISLTNLKQTLLKYDFDDKIELKCTDDGAKCMIFVDGILQTDMIENLFKTAPEVYKYSKNLEQIEYKDIELEQLQRYEICFEYHINKRGDSSQMIVNLGEDGVYIFDNIHDKPTYIKYLSDVPLYFDDKIAEVKDAF
jgi:hypothetical protein